MRVENVDDSVIWSEAVYQTLDVIYSLCFMYKVTGNTLWLLTFVSG